MKNQQVSVDYWAMLKNMFIYGVLVASGWLMLRLFNTAFMLPRRLRAQQHTIQDTLEELKQRFPNLNITEEELRDAEREYEQMLKDEEEMSCADLAAKTMKDTTETAQSKDDKKTL